MGFINSEGKEVIKPQYTQIMPFDQVQRGWALVERDGLWGFISSEGREVVKPKYEKISFNDSTAFQKTRP